MAELEELDRQVEGVAPADTNGEGGTVVDGNEQERSLDLLVQKMCRRMFRSPPPHGDDRGPPCGDGGSDNGTNEGCGGLDFN